MALLFYKEDQRSWSWSQLFEGQIFGMVGKILYTCEMKVLCLIAPKL